MFILLLHIRLKLLCKLTSRYIKTVSQNRKEGICLYWFFFIVNQLPEIDPVSVKENTNHSNIKEICTFLMYILRSTSDCTRCGYKQTAMKLDKFNLLLLLTIFYIIFRYMYIQYSRYSRIIDVWRKHLYCQVSKFRWDGYRRWENLYCKYQPLFNGWKSLHPVIRRYRDHIC